MTQCEKVLDYRDRFGSISQLEALADLGIMRLASRICDIEKSGIAINRQTVKTKNRFGDKVHYTRYSRM